MERAAIYQLLSYHRYGVISSIRPDGAPQSALVGIAATSGLEIIFDTLKTSRKYCNLMERPACSLVIGWQGGQSLQLEGIAEEPFGADLKRYQDDYFAVWPDGPARLSWPNLVHLVVHPRWARYSDFDENPPLIREMTF